MKRNKHMKKKSITLNIKTVIKNAKDCLRRGKMQFQNAKASENDCQYSSGNGVCCVIGASLYAKDGKRFDRRSSRGDSSAIDDLINQGFVKTDDPEGLLFLQQQHDDLVGCDAAGDSIKERTTLMNKAIARMEKVIELS